MLDIQAKVLQHENFDVILLKQEKSVNIIQNVHSLIKKNSWIRWHDVKDYLQLHTKYLHHLNSFDYRYKNPKAHNIEKMYSFSRNIIIPSRTKFLLKYILIIIKYTNHSLLKKLNNEMKYTYFDLTSSRWKPCMLFR